MCRILCTLFLISGFSHAVIRTDVPRVACAINIFFRHTAHRISSTELDYRSSALRNRHTARTYCHTAFRALTQKLAKVGQESSLAVLCRPDVIYKKETDPVFKPRHREIHGISHSSTAPNHCANFVPPLSVPLSSSAPPITLCTVAHRPSVMNRIPPGNRSRISGSEAIPSSATVFPRRPFQHTIRNHTGGRGHGT